MENEESNGKVIYSENPISVSGADESITPAAEVFASVNEEITNNKRDLRRVLEEKLEMLKHEEKEIFENIESKEHSKRLLLNELNKIDTSLENMRSKIKSISIASKCAKAAYKYLCETLSEQQLSEMSANSSDDIKKLETFLWFLKSKGNSENATREALSEFYKFCVSFDEILDTNENLWCEIIVHLLDSLESSRPDLQYLLLGILAEISRKEEFVEVIKREDGFPLVVKSLKSINELVNGEACSCITNFSSNQENKRFLGEIGAIHNLVQLVWRSQNVEVLEKSVTALWTLAMQDENKVIIREQQGIPAICSLLTSPNPAILENAAMALGYLTRDDENKVAVREADGLKLLLDVLSFPNDAIQSKVAGALWNCASNNENKEILRELNAIPTLLDLLSSESEGLLENVTGCLWNLAVDNNNKKVIFEKGGIPTLVSLLNSSNESIVENVTGTLWNCASLPESKVLIRKVNGFQPLLNLLQSKNENIRENAAGAIRNCAINDQNKQTLREINGIHIFISMLDETTKLSILEKITSTLWICSIDQDNKIEIRKEGGIPKLISLLSHKTLSLIEKVLGTLRNCSTINENKMEIKQCKGIPKLIELLKISSQPIREYSAATLWNCAISDEIKKDIRDYGGIEALVSLLTDTSDSVLENVAGCLLTLTIDEENRERVRDSGGLTLLVNILDTSHNEFVLENTLSVLKNCASNKLNIKILGNELRIIPLLIQILSNDNENIVREAALCLKNLSTIDEVSIKIGKAKGVENLLHIINSTKSDSIKKVCALTIQSLAKNRKFLFQY